MGLTKAKSKTFAEEFDDGKSILANITTMKDLQIIKWQRISYISLFIAFFSVGGMIYTATKATFIPYIVNVDEKTGYFSSLGALTEVKKEITPAIIYNTLSRFVEMNRSIPADEYWLEVNLKRSLAFLTPESAGKYKNLYLNQFTDMLGTKISRIDIISVQPIAKAKDTYQVRWKETITDRGIVSKPIEKNYVGNFNIEERYVKEKKDLADNPLGIYITDFEINEERSVEKK